MQDFRRLKVWEKAHHLNLRIADLVDKYPRSELFVLTFQMRKSASSVPTNVAEGCGQGSDAGFARYLQIAMGSACELEYQLIFSRDRRYVTAEVHAELEADLLEVKRMLAALLTRLRGGDS
jgi:four helix bundle protein